MTKELQVWNSNKGISVYEMKRNGKKTKEIYRVDFGDAMTNKISSEAIYDYLICRYHKKRIIRYTDLTKAK